MIASQQSTAPRCAEFVVVIPARYASTRLPGKPLLIVGGKPLIQHVYEHAVASAAKTVVIATDDVRIQQVAQGFGAVVSMTDPRHMSGSDRVAEAVEQMRLAPDSVVVNVQGDEPLLPPSLISQVANNLAQRPTYQMATLCEPITEVTDILTPERVKVVFDHAGRALYFSRAPIPWCRGDFEQRDWGNDNRCPSGLYKHIGLYAYKARYLQQFVALPPSSAELSESLEQLRALHHNASIHVDIAVEAAGDGIDTLDDLERLRAAHETHATRGTSSAALRAALFGRIGDRQTSR